VNPNFGAYMKDKKSILQLFCLISIIFFGTHSSFSAQLIQPSNPDINYYGRIDFSDPEAPKYCWSGVIIEAAFTGSTIGMKIDHKKSYYDIEVDDTFDTIVDITSSGEYIFTNNLSDGNHIVRIKLRSEDHYSAASFQGLLLAESGEVLDAPSKPSRKIEFIGDSYTAGYGVESPGRDCDSELLNKYTNAHSTFAANVTKAFHAQSIILGWSGAGMVRNYGAGSKRSDDPFPAHYNRTLGIVNANTDWDYSKWKPELVVICLGTNDYSTSPQPDDSMYIGDYHKFIERIRTNYPDASILCVSTGDETFEKNVETVVSEQKTTYGNTKIYSARYPSSLENTGCDWHPNVKDNIKVADVLIETIMDNLGWDTTETAVRKTYAQKGTTSKHNGFQIIRFQNQVVVKAAGKIPDRQTIHVLSLDGKTILNKSTDADGRCTIPESVLRGNVFAIGNDQIGWQRFITISSTTGLQRH
jgi:lysophospholipase L1-like esterase